MPTAPAAATVNRITAVVVATSACGQKQTSGGGGGGVDTEGLDNGERWRFRGRKMEKGGNRGRKMEKGGNTGVGRWRKVVMQGQEDGERW